MVQEGHHNIKDKREKGMVLADVDARISKFLNRKQAEFPELAAAGRHGSRTVKYAMHLRSSGQLLLVR